MSKVSESGDDSFFAGGAVWVWLDRYKPTTCLRLLHKTDKAIKRRNVSRRRGDI